MPGKVDFKINVPVEVSLKLPTGHPVKSQFGKEEMMFTLTDGRKMYLPAYVGRKIAALNVGEGGRVRITKSARTDGRQGSEWDVEPLESADSGIAKTKPAVSSSLTSATAIASDSTPRPARVSTGTVSGHSEKLARVLHNLRNYAKNNGLALSADDTRSIVITAYIQQMQGGEIGRETRQ